MARLVTTIDITGPLFQADPTRTFDENVHVMMEAFAREGEEDLKAKLEQDQSSREELSFGGRVSEHIHGRVESLAGKRWHRWVTISPDRTGVAGSSIALYAAASAIETERHPFRASYNRLRRARSLTVAELTKGLD